MLGVVAFDLLPEALVQSPFSVHGVPLPMLTFALAFLAIHIVERSIGMHDAHEGDYAIHRHTRAGVGLTAAQPSSSTASWTAPRSAPRTRPTRPWPWPSR